MVTAAESNFELAREMYSPKIRTWARKSCHSLPGYDVNDFESEMLVVLWHCVQTYNPNNGARFSTLFWRSAKNRLMDLQQKYAAKKRKVELVYIEDLCVEDWDYNETEIHRFNFPLRLRVDSAEDYALARLMVQERLSA